MDIKRLMQVWGTHGSRRIRNHHDGPSRFLLAWRFDAENGAAFLPHQCGPAMSGMGLAFGRPVSGIAAVDCKICSKQEAPSEGSQTRTMRLQCNPQAVEIVRLGDCQPDFLHEGFQEFFGRLLAKEADLIIVTLSALQGAVRELEVVFRFSYPLARRFFHRGRLPAS